MSPMELVFITLIGCSALLGVFIVAWGALTLYVAADAALRGHDVKQAIAPLLEEL